MKPYISKSEIINHIRCPLMLWLQRNKPDNVADESNIPMIVNGDLAGEQARKQYTFADGTMVEWEGWQSAVEKTKELMADENIKTIFEGTFIFDGVLVRTDILTRAIDDNWNMVEVKSATKLAKHHFDDVAIQRYVVENAGINLVSCSIMYIDKNFIYQGNDDYKELFLFEDVNDECDARREMVQLAIQNTKNTISQTVEPKEEMAPRCKRDFVCPSKKYCESLAPYDHISFLPRGGKVQEKIAKLGFNRISEIPSGLLTSENHKKVYEVTLANEINGSEFYLEGAKEFIDALPYPHHYLDFETIQFSVPHWPGVRCWRQVPFQFSDHVHNEDGTEGYEYFLDASGNDPRRDFAESVVKQCAGDEGTILVYNQAFERMVLMDLIVDFPDLAEELESIRARCFDLFPLMKTHYYNVGMSGSWSIKKILKCFVPDMDYADLDEVQNGTEAQTAYLNLVDPFWTGDKDKLTKNALEYCKYDTLSMVKIVENIIKRETT